MSEASINQALQLADQCYRQSQLAQAEGIYRRVLAVDAQNALATHGMGVIALRVNRPDIAIDLLIKSTARLSDNPVAHCALGDAQLALGRMERAAESYRRALALNPDLAEAHCNLGITLQESARIEEAIECFQRAAVLAPQLVGPWNNLGNAFQLLGRYGEAIAAYEKAISLAPNLAATHNHLAAAVMESGRIDEAIAACRRGLEIDPHSAGTHSNLLAFLPCDPNCDAQTIFAEHRRWNELHAKPLANSIRTHTNNRSPDRRLRIGYVSPDFRDHPIAYFLEGLLAAHDATQFEITCYADLQRQANPDSRRLEKSAARWRNITGLGDAHVADMVRQDQIDILVDLAGHTASNRLLLFARKPAPIQVTYLGYPNTTGLDAIDYRLTDPLADPPGATDEFHSEQLIRLPKTFACYQPYEDAPAINPPPAETSGYVTFGSFNKLSKINANVIATWAEILRLVPNSKLLFMARGAQDEGVAQRIVQAFATHGISSDRLELADYQDRAGFFAAHHRVDLMLDPFPVNGHTITCHALWMGVPVVCLEGATHISRLGVSVLSNLKLNELIAYNKDEYVQIAASLASDRPRLAAYRAALRQRMAESALMDYAGFARAVESAFREMWQRWCAAGRLRES